MNQQSIHKKWTNGQPYERTKRLKRILEEENREYGENLAKAAYTSSLNHDENTWDILNRSIYEKSDIPSGFTVSNRREELGNKLAERGMMQQIGANPFFERSDYLNDIAVRDQHLKPVNTTQGARAAAANASYVSEFN